MKMEVLYSELPSAPMADVGRLGKLE